MAREVVKVKAKKINEFLQTETKKFCVDPQLTDLCILRDLLRRAFSLNGDFIVSYLEESNSCSSPRDVARYLPLLSEWDLNKALSAASEPYLFLKVDTSPFENCIDDLIDNEENCLSPSAFSNSRSSSSNSSFNFANSVNSVLQKIGGNGSSSNGSGSKLLTNLSRRIGAAHNSNSSHNATSRKTLLMNDLEFRSYLDGNGRLLREKAFRLSVYQNGLEPSLRAVVWRHLLNVYPKTPIDADGCQTEEMTGKQRMSYTKSLAEKYFSLKNCWLTKFKAGHVTEQLRQIANAVRKDVLRTDRTHDFYAGDDDQNKNVLSLFYLLVTYGITHPDIGYCQGMSDLASPLLVVMNDEAQAYVCFCALMKRLKRNFANDGRSMIKKFHHLNELLQFYDPTFYEYLREMRADDLLFCYRWLLLEMKREFSFDDALTLMEVMWASLPPDPPVYDSTLCCLFDVDITTADNSLPNVLLSADSTEDSSFIVDEDDDDAYEEDCFFEDPETKEFSTLPRKYRSLSLSNFEGSPRLQAIVRSVHLLNKKEYAPSLAEEDSALKTPLIINNDGNGDILANRNKANSSRIRRYTVGDGFVAKSVYYEELAVTDGGATASKKSSPKKQSPVPIAVDACSRDFRNNNEEHNLTLSEIGDICLLHASFSSMDLTQNKNRCSNVDNASTKMSNSASAPCLDEESNEDALDDYGIPPNFGGGGCLLPAPDTLGDGNPFMLFVCLTLLLQHRDVIIRNRMDFNDIAVYFDKMMRRHKVHRVLKRARRFFTDYLKSNWFETPSESASATVVD